MTARMEGEAHAIYDFRANVDSCRFFTAVFP